MPSYDIHDPINHDSAEWATMDATDSDDAVIRYLESTGVHPGENPLTTYPILVRAVGADWECVGVGGALAGDEEQGVWVWDVRGRWIGPKVAPPIAVGGETRA